MNDPEKANHPSLETNQVDSKSLPNIVFKRTWLHRALRVAYLIHLLFNYVLRPCSRGSYVAVWVKDQLLIIQNSYKKGITVPSGGIKREETPLDAARRELAEEVGLTLGIDDLRLVWQTENRSEFKRDTIYFFEAHLPELPKVTVDGKEVVWAEFCSASKLLTMQLVPPLHGYLTACNRSYGVSQ